MNEQEREHVRNLLAREIGYAREEIHVALTYVDKTVPSTALEHLEYATRHLEVCKWLQKQLNKENQPC